MGEGVVRAGGLALRDNKNQTWSAVRSLFEKWKNSRWREGQGHGILFPFPSPVLFLPCVSKQCVHWFPIQDFNLNNVGQSISCWNLLDFHASYVSEIESCLNKHAWVIRFNHCIVFH